MPRPVHGQVVQVPEPRGHCNVHFRQIPVVNREVPNLIINDVPQHALEGVLHNLGRLADRVLLGLQPCVRKFLLLPPVNLMARTADLSQVK